MSAAYDERLAAAAPAATRAEKQEGYDVDLLNEQQSGRGVSVSPPPLPVLSANHGIAEAGEFTTDYVHAPPHAVPWYKTRKTLLILLLGGVVIAAAVIGGAVGGTVGPKHKAATVATSDPGGGGGSAGSDASQATHGDDAGEAASRETYRASASTTGTPTADTVAITGLIPTVTAASSDNHDHDHGGNGP
ncbi:hypothetical protein BN946_scf184836.g35 [Trametes cinnabarina]|uniref:Uncharacterized protein n=1 Tax=Pycnoporus cinnabarinus TaxID=5643 RepID=A0A060S6X2_PYCCI|nr:hypothetical protein BN946_scf184836.g35 [Trametes cinnabarina]